MKRLGVSGVRQYSVGSAGACARPFRLVCHMGRRFVLECVGGRTFV